MNFIYHITISTDWDEALISGEYRADSLAAEGFLHASTILQVEASANRYFARLPTIVLLKIDLDRVRSPVIWEQSSHSEDPFPHIYGPLNLDSVVEVVPWNRSDKGRFVYPPSLPLQVKNDH